MTGPKAYAGATYRGREAVVDRAACRDLPGDWWDTGDDGNRLALAICHQRCQVRELCGQGNHTGVISGGVPYGDTGKPVPLCSCGHPVTQQRGGTECHRCNPPQPRRWRGTP